MCYAFAFFNFGFIVPLVALALLKWTSSRHWDSIFATPVVWSILLNLFIYMSAAAVTGALCLLSVTIVLLHFSKDTGGTYTDSPAQFNVDPRVAGASVIACAVITAAMSLIAVALHYMANGWHTLLSDFAGRRKQKPGLRLEEYIAQ
ncbi:hypothetical protein EIP86_009601 [Pleurotus ostreatoroseus]|nr:hypothetical protein EIP86_009601 [Pleurotus ostreatoroseus]